MLKLKGEKEMNLSKDEILILSNNNELIKPINEKLKNSNKINIKGKEYVVKNHEVIEGTLNTDRISYNDCTIVINDEFLSDCEVFESVLNVMYTGENREENNKKYEEIDKNSWIGGKFERLNLPHIDAY